jgi:hypothetical protein
MIFTCVAPHIKSKGLPIGGLLLSKNLVFYIRSTAYKKQGAPDRWSLTRQKFRVFTCVAPHTKSNGLPIGGPLLSKNLAFLHVWHHIQKARGSRSTVPFSVKLRHFTRVAPRIKSKELPIDGPLLNKNLCFLHA